MNGYKLSRNFWDFAFSNPEKIKPHHIAIYFFSIEHCNRLGWKDKFGIPTSMVMEATGIKSYRTYKKHFDDLIEFGFFNIIEFSKNQFSSNIIALSSKVKAPTKALDKALIKHRSKHIPKQVQSTYQSIASIDKQVTINKEPIKQGTNIPPLINELVDYFFEKTQSQDLAKLEAEKFINLYESKGWMIGKNKMKNWKSAVRGWILRIKDFKNNGNKLNIDERRAETMRNVAIKIATEHQD